MERTLFKKWAWIHSATVDLGLLHFAWVPVAILFAVISKQFESTVCDFSGFSTCSPTTLGLTAITFYALSIHRHYTFFIIYGSRSQFEKHRTTYIALPIALAVIFFSLAGIQQYGYPYNKFAWYALLIVSAPNAIWNIYHITMQKYGFFRIYASKLGYGVARLEKQLLKRQSK